MNLRSSQSHVEVKYLLGLDPGLNTTGYGVLEIAPAGPRVVEAGVLRSNDKHDLPDRLKSLYEGLLEVLDQWTPSAIAVEQLYSHTEYPRTSILMAHARGCFLLAGAQRGIPVFSYAATQVKKAITGSGRATKDQMQHCIRRELNLATLPEPHDVADALGIALCHHFSSTGLGTRSTTFTGVNRKALFGESDDG